jgi:hypothetical protein
VPSWQAEADLAAGHWCGLLADTSRRRAIAPDVSAVAAGFAEDQGLRRLLVERGAASIRSARA